MDQHKREVEHWIEYEKKSRRGERQIWLDHPRVEKHFDEKALLEGLDWRDWVCRELGRKPRQALELGCGDGRHLYDMARLGYAESIIGLDLEFSRFAVTASKCQAEGLAVTFLECDANEIELSGRCFDLIYAHHSIHHFERLEHIFDECGRALADDGFVVFEEYVGPNRFQWTNEQLGLTSQLLALLPEHLRMYPGGMLKQEEGRSTVEQVAAVCPSEAIRSQDIVPEFGRHFEVLWNKRLGGTIQQLLYNGIIQNFPDDDPYTLHAMDCISGLEQVFIDYGIVQSDFVLLVGKKKQAKALETDSPGSSLLNSIGPARRYPHENLSANGQTAIPGKMSG